MMRPRVLVVDDDATLAQTIHDVLELDGIDVVASSDTAGLASVVASAHPDVLLIDLMLAATTGVELAAELRSGPLAEIPRMAMSSSPFMCEIAEESDLFTCVLSKPLDFDDLAVRITECVARAGAVDPPS